MSSPGGPPPVGTSAPKKSGLFSDPKIGSGLGLVCGVVAAGVSFVISNLPVAVLAGVGLGIGLVLGIIAAVVTKPGMLSSAAMVGVAALGGAIGGGGMWFVTHPTVWIDNAGTETLTIFVDGEKVETVGPDQHVKVNVYKGDRKLGYGPKGAKKPEETSKVEIGMSGAYLYNPGKTGCYYLDLAVYGSASTSGKKVGPQPVQEFYRFDKVDNWWTDNPEMVTLDKKKSGTTKVALQRYHACKSFKKCTVAVREKFVKCAAKAFTIKSESKYKEALNACGDAAAQSCTSTGTSSKKPASTKKSTKKK